MDPSFDDLSFDTRSDLIDRAFASGKPSPYTNLSSLYDFPVMSTPQTRQNTFDEYQRTTTGRSSVSVADSIETTHAENTNDFSWSNVAELNTPTQSSQIDASEKNGTKLLKVIKTIFTQNILDVFRNYVEEVYVKDLKTMIVQYETGKIVLDVDGFRIRVFSMLRKCLANNTEANIVRIFEALREKYDVQLIEEIPSFGSITHSNGYCKPCVFANKAVNSCKNGADCNFCHFQHKITRRKGATKDSVETPKQAKNTTPTNTDDSSPSSLPAGLRKGHPAWLSTSNAAKQSSNLVDEGFILNLTGTKKAGSFGGSVNHRSPRNTTRSASNIDSAEAIDLDGIINDDLVTKCLEYLKLEHNTNMTI